METAHLLIIKYGWKLTILQGVDQGSGVVAFHASIWQCTRPACHEGRVPGAEMWVSTPPSQPTPLSPRVTNKTRILRFRPPPPAPRAPQGLPKRACCPSRGNHAAAAPPQPAKGGQKVLVKHNLLGQL